MNRTTLLLVPLGGRLKRAIADNDVQYLVVVREVRVIKGKTGGGGVWGKYSHTIT